MRDGTSVSRQSMRAFLCTLEEAGELVTISQPVKLDYEVAACLSRSVLALRFANVGDDARSPKMQVVGNLLNSLPRFAMGMSSATDAIQASLLA